LVNIFSRGIVKSDKIFHEATSFMRVLPDFLIIGNSFCCKTLLYDYMIQHPLVLKNLREETAYWGWHFNKGMSWYRSNFPTRFHKKIVEFFHRKNAHVGETINIPVKDRPEQIDKILSKPKIIVILRNPIERTFVRYLADVRAGIEERSFEDALEIPKPKSKILKKMKMNEIKGVDENASLYITGSIYYYDLKRWNEFFPVDRMLFITSEDLINQPLKTVNKALGFLELEPLNSIKKIGKNWEENAEKMNFSTREELKGFFEPHNEKLFDFIGKKFDWK
jgi:hypothetical protein